LYHEQAEQPTLELPSSQQHVCILTGCHGLRFNPEGVSKNNRNKQNAVAPVYSRIGSPEWQEKIIPVTAMSKLYY